ncbi:MAG: NapC/NirT family cytochrome c [Gammaproteobacteria bacterium]|jgi:nitrate/TMAO reductase-like tetraheme cytochrome c subunit|nr:NapC/NirT family cytochrome c [Gammaproteobacteria bacterium]
MEEPEKKPGLFSRKFMLGTTLGGALIFMVVGVIFWGGFNTFMEFTNTMTFCTSCHEMDHVYEEYEESVHFKNASGVKAICADCHVPKPWGAKLWRKMQASTKELPHKILGTINTKEKFEAKRLELAESVWASMEATDSRECRNCHALESMELEEQGKSARKKHTLERKIEKDETCIDCHKGIAHTLPEGYE